MKFIVPNFSCLQIPVLSVLCPQLNLLKPAPSPEQNSWVRHCKTVTPIPNIFLLVLFSWLRRL